jgi:beta-galactosidase
VRIPKLSVAAFLFLAAHGASPVPKGPFLGVAWYPEQWPESTWENDVTLMERAGIRMVRIGEFAWSSMEPREGVFQFDWLAHAIEKAAAHHIVTVLGTPTDAPPAWLTEKYPETLNVDANGRRASHGMRRQFSYGSTRYRELSRLIVSKMAERFGANSNVVGWQIGNEFTDDSYDPESRRRFHQWLAAKYKTLDELNRRWTTAYWSQTYTSWDQVPMESTRGNPGLLLDYHRFVSDTWRDFVRNQVDAIRAVTKTQFVTTNYGGLGWADRFDRYLVASDLDFITWDDYVGSGHLNVVRNGATHDLARGWKRKNFWVMEAQPGFVDWAPVSNSLDPGEVRDMAWQAVGHGADCYAFWQWRSALNGQEQYHGTLAGADGQPVPLYDEVQRIGREFATASKAIDGTEPISQVAILHDYDSRWAIDFHPQSQRYDQIQVLLDYYEPLRRATQSVDIVAARAPLGRYKLVAAPSLNVIDDELAKHLLDYVEQGGQLVLGPRSGMKDADNSLETRRQPGPLVPSLGGRVEQFYALLDEIPVDGNWGKGKAVVWAEMLTPLADNTEVVMRYGTGNGWLDGKPAVLTRPLGKGSITYVGALLDKSVMQNAMQAMLQTAGIRAPFAGVPDGVEVCRRVGGGREVFVLINYEKQERSVPVESGFQNVLSGGAQVNPLVLPARGVAVLERTAR